MSITSQEQKAIKGTLYLIPSSIGRKASYGILAPDIISLLNTLSVFIIEDERNAIRFLKPNISRPIEELTFLLLNEHTKLEDYFDYLSFAEKGRSIGLLSDAGCPAVADPGAQIVKQAHNKGIKVVPVVGPSSILLALMASGFNGQHFLFHGYLPIDREARIRKLKEMEHDANAKNQTQIFIETPYRNQKLLEDILLLLKNKTQLCIAASLTNDDENVKSKTIAEWKQLKPEIHKIPCVFLVYR